MILKILLLLFVVECECSKVVDVYENLNYPAKKNFYEYLVKECLKLNSTILGCDCYYKRWGPFKTDDIQLEELLHFKFFFKCISIRPLKELVSYYKIKSRILSKFYGCERQECNSKTFCDNLNKLDGDVTQAASFCKLYYIYEYNKKFTFSVRLLLIQFLSSEDFKLELSSNLVEKSIFKSILNTK